MKIYTKQKEVNLPIVLASLIGFLFLLFFVDLSPGNPAVTTTAAIAALMAVLWVSEALPVGVTSLLPIILFPLFGVLDGKEISNAYINYVIFLYIGGFLMALAMEQWNLHKRIALAILSVLGSSHITILAGFLLASAFLSMWMSNTATAMMMLPIAFSIILTLEESNSNNNSSNLAIGLLLSVAYGCSLGGVATLVGTPPNLSFVRIFDIIYPAAPEISFGQWFVFALPLSVIIFFVVLFVLYWLYPTGNQSFTKSFFKEEYRKLGPVSTEQKRVFILFIILVFLWVFRRPLEIGSFTIPGWSMLFDHPEFINDGTIAIFMAILLFIIPSSKKDESLIQWEIVSKIPWGIVLLFGGGFALAKAVVDSGLADYVGQQLAGAGSLSNIGLVATVTSLMTVLTEFTSNTATTEMMLPIVSGLSDEIGVHPLFLMIPVTLAASMAFMFPIATPPNAVVFGTGRLRLWDMFKAGIIINIIAIGCIILLTVFWSTVIFDIDPRVVPEWVQ